MNYNLSTGTVEDKRNRAHRISAQIDRDNASYQNGGASKRRIGIIALVLFVVIAGLLAIPAESVMEYPDTSLVYNQQDSVTINYALKCVKEFEAEPNSMNLHKLGCTLHGASLMEKPLRPDVFLNRHIDGTDEYKSRIMLLVSHTLWFTDYIYQSPAFRYGGYTFRYDDSLLGMKKWYLMANGENMATATWGQIVCLVMNIDYDPEYDLSLIVQCGYKPTSPTDHPLFIGPKQFG